MQAHDKIVKTVLSDIRLAKCFMNFHLPLALKKDINLDTLKIEKGTFVDRSLREHLSDLLYSVNVKGQESYIYLLLESQSTVDPLMAFRLLQYTVQIMQQHLKSNKNSKRLPLVYPMVYYTGQPSKKGFTRNILDCFENPNLAKQYFLKPFKLIDLNTFSDDDLLKDKLLSGLQLVQKHIYQRDLSLVLDKMLAQDVFVLMHQFDDNGDYLHSMLRYIYHKVEAKKPENFIRKLQQQVPEDNTAMTIAEYFKNKGKTEGKAEGKAEGKLMAKEAIAKKMLDKGFEPADIREMTALSEKQLARIA